MTDGLDRLCVLLAVLGLAMTLLAGVSLADQQPDREPTSSAPVADRDTMLDRSAEAVAEDAYDALRAGHWLAAFGFALWLLVMGARSLGGWLGGRWVWLRSDRGGAITALAMALAVEAILLATSGRSMTFSGVLGAFVAAGVAAGGRNLVSRIVYPRDRPGAPDAA